MLIMPHLITILAVVVLATGNHVSAFLHTSVVSLRQPTPQHTHRQQFRTDNAVIMQMNYKSPDEGNSYNDDAFGFVFLTGGILTQDVDFVGTFAALSAIAAVGTGAGFVKKDERAPAVVATTTLLVAPVAASLRQSGSLGHLSAPMPAEFGLCLVSAAWAFFNWSRQDVDQ